MTRDLETDSSLRERVLLAVELLSDEDLDAVAQAAGLMRKNAVATNCQGCLLGMPVSRLGLSVRAARLLEALRIERVGDLVRMTKEELSMAQDAAPRDCSGRKSIAQIDDALLSMGLRLGMSDVVDAAQEVKP